MPPYKVKIDVFEGPFDLLLHLVRVHEMDIYDISISDKSQATISLKLSRYASPYLGI